MGADLEKHFGAEINLIAGSGGVFDVEVDGAEIFSKQQAGRFPELHEIIALIKR